MEKILTGEDVLLIKKTARVKKYNSETEGFKGKSYRIYAYGDKAFIVHEDDDFHQDFANGDIQKVMLTVSDEGLSLANHVTWKRANAQKMNQTKYDSISVDLFKPVAVTDELINSIG
jgi:hypothetical protein